VAQHTLVCGSQLAQVPSPDLQAWPGGALDWHLPVEGLQKGVLPEHWVSPVQLVKHADVPLQAKPPGQVIVVWGGQTPLLQLAARASTPLAHVWLAQTEVG